MPLRFLQTIKAKHEKLKKRSKSTTDLLQAQGQLSAASAQMIPIEGGLKKKSLSKPYLRYSSKEYAQEPLKKIKEHKDKSCTDLREIKKAESQTSNPGLRTSNLRSQTSNPGLRTSNLLSVDKDSYDHNGNTLPQLRTSRSASSFSMTEETSREKRLSDMALLDQYIGYHQRRVTDDGSSTTRLVCAQLLRESLLRVEQRHLSDGLPPSSKQDLSRSMSNLNQIPTNIAKPTQYQKNPQRRLSSMVGLSQHNEPRLSLSNVETRKSSTSLYSPDNDDDGPIQFSCKTNSNDFYTENDRDIRTRSLSTDNSNFKDLFKKPKAMSKRRSVPNFTQQEIEIF